MGSGAALVTADAALAELDALPEQFRQITEALVEAQRATAWSAFASGSDSLYVFRETRLNNRIFLTSSAGGLRFAFRRPPAAEVVLDADIAVTLRPRPGVEPPIDALGSIEAEVPRFFGNSVPEKNRLALAAAIGATPAQLVCVDLGSFAFAARDAADISSARAAFMLKSASTADLVLPVAGAGFAFKPLPVMLVLNAIKEWHAGSTQTRRIAISPSASEAVPRLIAAIAGAWSQARMAGRGAPVGAELAGLLPSIDAASFGANVVLRLRDDGRVAAKKSDDNFQLRLSLSSTGSRLTMRVTPPDFLGSGALHRQMLDALKEKAALDRLFAQGDRASIESFLDGPPPVIFRAEKQGRDDVEMFVFKRDWSDISGLAVTMPLRVDRDEPDTPDDESKVVAKHSEAKLIYLCAEGETKPLVALRDFPQHLLKLISRLDNWERSLE